MKPKHRTRMIHRQSMIVGYEPEEAMATLPKLIATDEERRQALALCQEIAGPQDEMSRESIDMMNRLALALGQPPIAPAGDGDPSGDAKVLRIAEQA
jgi:hypothetical protein